MSEKGATDAPPAERKDRPVKFRRPASDLVQRVARRIVRGGKAVFPSQAAFREALLQQIRREEPLATIGGPRLRRLVVGVPGVRISVHYTERDDPRPLTECPVCGSTLSPIRNRTLMEETVVLGQRCTRCDYWTHRSRRIPVRYTFSRGAGRARPGRP